MPLNWWEVAPLGQATEPPPPDLDWQAADNLPQIQALQPEFVPYAERLYAAAQQVFEKKQEDSGDAWGFVKDIGGGLKKGLGWVSDKLADYNQRFVAPTAAWMYGGARGGVEAPNPLKAFAGNREEMDKAEQVLSKLHPMARLSLEFIADPMVWGTLPLTLGGGTLAKVTASAAARAVEAGATASAGERAALFLNTVGRGMDLLGHVPDRLMAAAIKPVGAVVSKAPLLPVSTAEGGVRGIKMAALGALSKTSKLARTQWDVDNTLRVLGANFMEQGDEKLAVRTALSHIADGTLPQETKHALMASQGDIVDDLTRFGKDIDLGKHIENLGRFDEDITGITYEIARDLRDARAAAWKVPKAAIGSEITKVSSQANRIYRSAMMTWVWGVLWSTNYMFQNMITDLMMAGPSALYWGIKARIGKTIMPHLPYERLQADVAQRSSALLQSTQIRRMATEEGRLALAREITDAHSLNPSELMSEVATTPNTTAFVAPPGMRTDTGWVVNPLAKLVNATEPELGSAQTLLRGALNKAAKGAETAALAPLRWAQWWDSTMWIGCMERHMVRTLREAATESPAMAHMSTLISNIGRSAEFRDLPADLRQALVMTWERSVTPEDITRQTFDLLKLDKEFVQFSTLPSAVPWAPQMTEALNSRIEQVMTEAGKVGRKVTGKEMRREGIDGFVREDLLSKVAIPATQEQADLQSQHIVNVARERGFTVDQIKQVSDAINPSFSSLKADMTASLGKVSREGGLTANEAKYELVKHLRTSNAHMTFARHMQEIVADESLDAGQVVNRLNNLRVGAEAARTETRFAVNELETETFRVRDLVKKGGDGAEDAWRALAENPKFGMGADMGVFAPDDPELIPRLFKAMTRGVDRQWTQLYRRAWEKLGVSKAAEISVEGYLPEMVDSLHKTLKGLWSERMDVLAQFQSGKAGNVAMAYGNEVADALRGLGAEGMTERANLLHKATDEAVDAANSILGNFYSGVTNFDELARHVFPFVRWSTRAPAIVARYVGRNPWFVPAVSRWVTETEKEQLPYFGAWMPVANIPLVGTLLAEPARQFAPYQMVRPIAGGPEIFGRGGAQQALSTLGVAGFFPGPLPQVAISRLTGEPTSPTGEFFPWQRAITQPLMVAGDEMKALAESMGAPGEMANAAKVLGLPEETLGMLADLAYGKVNQKIFQRDVERELVNQGLDIAEVEQGSDQWQAAARTVMTRNAIRFMLPFFQAVSPEQLAYTKKQAEAFTQVGISQAEQIALRKQGKSPWDLLNQEQSAKVSKLIGEEEMRRRAKVVPLGLTEGEAKVWSGVQSARALVQLKYDELHTKLADLGLSLQKGEITGREYREQRSTLKTNNYQNVLVIRQETIAALKGTDFANSLDEAGVRREWQNLSDSMRSSVGAVDPGKVMPEDDALEGYQEIRAESYRLPDGEIDWTAYRDAQTAYLMSVPSSYAEYIVRYEDRFNEDLPMEQRYQQALDDYDQYKRIPRWVGVSPKDAWTVDGVGRMVDTLQARFQQMTLGERSLSGQDAVTILWQQGLVQGRDAILFLMATQKNVNPISDYFKFTHPDLAMFGLAGAGSYLTMEPLAESTKARAEAVT